MALVLGTIAFLNEEIPPSINFGGDQVIRAHKYAGGRRVVDAMGPDDDLIKWGGEFTGLTAVIRARQLDLLRRSGKMVTLTWSVFSYKVIVVNFEADFEAPFKIPYKVSCFVVTDVIAEKIAPLVESLEEAVSGGISSALGISADDPVLGPIVGGVQTTIQNTVTSGRLDFSTLSGAALAGVQSYTGNAVSAVAENTSTVSAALSEGGGLAGVVASSEPVTAASSLASIAEAADGAYRSSAVEALLTNLRNNVNQVGK